MKCVIRFADGMGNYEYYTKNGTTKSLNDDNVLLFSIEEGLAKEKDLKELPFASPFIKSAKAVGVKLIGTWEEDKQGNWA